MTHLVFVYGTLKRCGWNNPLLKGAEFIGAATTRQHYIMAGGNGSVPYVGELPSHTLAAPIVGEVYAVDDATLARLDALEGHPHGYCRKPVTARLGPGIYAEAWLYFWPHWHKDDGGRAPVNGVHDWHPATFVAYPEAEEEFDDGR